MYRPYPHAADALLGMLFPFWQAVIAICVLLALVLSVRTLAPRGGSRMVRGLLVTGAAIVGIAVIGMLIEGWRT